MTLSEPPSSPVQASPESVDLNPSSPVQASPESVDRNPSRPDSTEAGPTSPESTEAGPKSPAPPSAANVEPLHRTTSPDTYFSHPERASFEARLAAALTHLHEHPHWREVVTAVGLLHRGVDIAAESYGPNTRGEAGDVLMRLRAAIPRPRWCTPQPQAYGLPMWVAVAGHGVLLVCLVATIIALALRK
jgi:hypothetical protein